MNTESILTIVTFLTTGRSEVAAVRFLYGPIVGILNRGVER